MVDRRGQREGAKQDGLAPGAEEGRLEREMMMEEKSLKRTNSERENRREGKGRVTGREIVVIVKWKAKDDKQEMEVSAGVGGRLYAVL